MEDRVRDGDVIKCGHSAHSFLRSLTHSRRWHGVLREREREVTDARGSEGGERRRARGGGRRVGGGGETDEGGGEEGGDLLLPFHDGFTPSMPFHKGFISSFCRFKTVSFPLCRFMRVSFHRLSFYDCFIPCVPFQDGFTASSYAVRLSAARHVLLAAAAALLLWALEGGCGRADPHADFSPGALIPSRHLTTLPCARGSRYH